MIAHLKLVEPCDENRQVETTPTLRRVTNAEMRSREYLTPAEVEALMATARKRSRYGHRDATMILVAYRHGLRVSELCRLEWSQVDFANGLLHVARLKGSISSTQPLRGIELRALRRSA